MMNPETIWLSERSVIKDYISYRTPFIQNAQDRQIHRQKIGCWLLGSEEERNKKRLLMNMRFLLVVVKMCWNFIVGIVAQLCEYIKIY
jgi:hypothetical protein